ncbi:TPA: hypothetical protein HA265_04235 [Candidatus Woesearchaeota archaeon]|nr:hypothetical protein [Candidatus Woesearchaeota archaeon]
MSFEEIDDEDIERVLGTHQEEINRATMQLEGERRGAYALALLRKIYSTQKGIIITDAFAESLAMIMRYTGENNYHPEFAGNNCRPAEPKQQTEGHVPDSIFGSELISEKSLDEVILMYMAEDMAEDDAESMMEIAARMKKTASASSDGPPTGKEGREKIPQAWSRLIIEKSQDRT